MKTLISLILCLISSLVHGQTSVECDSIYTFTETSPSFKNGKLEFFKYINDEVITTLSDCKEESLPTRLLISFTINKMGDVIEVTFNELYVSTDCKNKLRAQLLSMEGWIPGMINDSPVCSVYTLPISCILWK